MTTENANESRVVDLNFSDDVLFHILLHMYSGNKVYIYQKVECKCPHSDVLQHEMMDSKNVCVESRQLSLASFKMLQKREES